MNNFEMFLVLKGLQPVTVSGHIKGIERMCRKIGSPEPTKEEAEQYIASLYLSEYSYSYKSNSAKSLEYFFEFRGITIHFGRQKKPKTLIKDTLNESEVIRLICATRNTRERAIITLLAYSGLRPKEICRVRVSDFGEGMKEVFVSEGKGRRDGIIHMPGKCASTIMQYLSEYPRERGEYLFTILHNGAKYNQQALRKLMKVLSKRAGITKRVYPYLMRHSVATNMIKRGADILYVKEHLRHAWIDTTMRYIHSFSVSDRHERFIPHYS